MTHENATANDYWKSTAEIVISGIAVRLPESDNMEEFRQHLLNGDDLVTEDARRWDPGMYDLPKRNGKMKDISKFDASFFGVHPKQANTMDPQLRLVLECTYEAICDAGVNPESIRGTDTGVFVGCLLSETASVLTRDAEKINGYSLTGCTRSMFANRVSYNFDLRGPSFTVDTACSSSLLALQLALDAIRQGQCNQAIVAGTHVLLIPTTDVQFLRLGMLSPNGMCQTFDENGDGYVRSEGVCAVYLQKRSDAKRIHATVIHAKCNTDGFKDQGVTFPSGERQAELLRAAYAEAGLTPSAAVYVEAHGTGTRAGDPEEANSIASVFCPGRDGPLLVGSVKSNMGHSEPTSGLASVAKMIIAMEEGIIPKNLHFRSPNPNIPSLLDGRMKVVSEHTPWEGGIVGINSFGFGGSNVHAILNFEKSAAVQTVCVPEMPKLFCCSGRTRNGLENMLRFAQQHASNHDLYCLLSELMFTPTNLHPYRGHVFLHANADNNAVLSVNKIPPQRRSVWFIYSGMGTQWPGMARDLTKLRIFDESLRRCSDVLTKYGLDIYSLIMAADPQVDTNNLYSVTCIVAIQVALTDTLRFLGVEPDGIIGHSVGELGCSYVDGCFTLEQTMLCAYWRGKCVEEANLPLGGMAAVGLSWEEAQRRCPAGVVPACHNAADSVTVSGPAEAVKQFIEELQAEDIFAKEVNTTVPFHSEFMHQVAPSLKENLEKVIPEPMLRSSRWLSSSTPEADWQTELSRYCSASYHVNNVISPVLFHECLQQIPNHAVVIEVAPDALLQAILKRSLKQTCTPIGLTSRKVESHLEFILAGFGKIYEAGVNIDAKKLYPSVSYPVPRSTPMISPQIGWDHSQSWYVVDGMEAVQASSGANVSCSYTVDPFNPELEDQFLLDHVLDGRPLYPFSGFIVLVWKTLARLAGVDFLKAPVRFEHIVVHRATVLSHHPLTFDVCVLPGNGQFSIREGQTMVASGVASLIEPDELSAFSFDYLVSAKPCDECGKLELQAADAYREILIRGYEYGPHFQTIQSACKTCDQMTLRWNDNWITFIDAIIQTALFRERNDDTLQLPTRLEYFRIDPQRHLDSVQTKADGTKVIRTTFDESLSGILAGGIEASEIISFGTPRRNQASMKPKLSKIRFVKYFDNECLATDPVSREQLRTYRDSILKYAAENFDKLCEEPSLMKTINRQKPQTDKNGTVHIIPDQNNNKHSKAGFDAHRDTRSSSSLEAYLSDGSKFGIARLLTELLQQKSLDGTNGINVHVPANAGERLDGDVLWSSIYLNEVVHPLLGLQLENTGGHFTRCAQLEPQSSKLALICKQFHESHPLTEADWTLVAESNVDQLSAEEPVQQQQLTVANFAVCSNQALPENLRNLDLIVLDRLLFQKGDVLAYLKRVKEFLRADGFVLVNEFTASHDLTFALASLSGLLKPALKADDSPITKANHFSAQRAYGAFYSHDQWLKFFASAGFSVVAWRTDKLLATAYLIRSIRPEPLQPVFVNVDDCAEFSWVDALKSALEERANAPPEQTVWIVASNSPDNGIVGFAQCLKEENVKNRVRLIFNAAKNSPGFFNNGYLESPEIKAVLARDMFANIYKDGEWTSIRQFLVNDDAAIVYKECEHAYINTLVRGDLNTLTWLESSNQFWPINKHPGSMDELISVYYSALNFRDVMVATGRISADSIPVPVAQRHCLLGVEFSGRLNTNGKRVMGLVPCQGLASTISTWQHVLYDVPEHWSLEEAATVPMAYLTAYYALIARGQLKKGESVLIHSGSGGVGQAALSIALAAGANVFTTVGTEEKKLFLKSRFPQLQDSSFSSSRSTDFLNHIMRETRGRGVDLVLNSLSEEKLMASIKCTAKNGRFLEIGKFDIARNTNIGMAMFMKNISFHGILLENIQHGIRSDEWSEVSDMLVSGIAAGVVRPLQATVFEVNKVQEAFRYMAAGKHVGKVLVQMRQEENARNALPKPIRVKAVSRTFCNPNHSFIITGGLGGFGLELTLWLYNRGARRYERSTGKDNFVVSFYRRNCFRFVLTSRTGVRTGYQARLLHHFEKNTTAKVLISTQDISRPDGASALIKEAQALGPVGGIFHLAMVLRDSYFENQKSDNFKQSAEAKFIGTINLDVATRNLCDDNLRWFVGFSSIASAFGNEGQTAYGWANSAMERIIDQRVRDGLPGISMQWGAIGDVGVVLEKLGDNNTVVGGTLPQRINSCLAVFDAFLSWDHHTLLSYVRAETTKKSSNEQADMVHAIAHILGISDIGQVDPDANLGDLGLDSLMGVEIKRALERDYDMVLSTKEIRFLTLNKIKALSVGGAEALKSFQETNAANAKEATIAEDAGGSATALSPMAFFRLNVDPQNVRPDKALVKINNATTGPKLFFVHTIEGVAQPLEELAAKIPSPVYCFQAVPEAPKEDVSKLAEFYNQHMRSIQPEGPYHLFGYSYGAPVVLEMAVQLQQQAKAAGETAGRQTVKSLVFLDGSVAYTQMYRQMFRTLYNVTDDNVFDTEALAAFAMRFVELDYKTFREELTACNDLQARIAHTVAKVMTSKLFDSPEPVAYAAEALCTRLRAADSYQPGAKFDGDAILIKAETKTNAVELGLSEDYGVSSLVTGAVAVHAVKGDHYSFIREDAADYVSTLIMEIVLKA